jgi:hypothetical protein
MDILSLKEAIQVQKINLLCKSSEITTYEKALFAAIFIPIFLVVTLWR